MACLLETRDVVCFSGDRYYKIKFVCFAILRFIPSQVIHVLFFSFPSQSFPSTIQQTYRPPMSAKNASIAKVVCCDGNFAALTSNGEVFTFSIPLPNSGSVDGGKEKSTVKPQRVWDLRNQYRAAKVIKQFPLIIQSNPMTSQRCL